MKNSSDLPTWKLNDIYKNQRDPKIELDLKRAEKMSRTFSTRFRGKLSPKPAEVKKALALYEEVCLVAVKPVIYASLLFAESCEPSGRGAFMQNVKARYIAIHQDLLFFELELLKFKLSELKKLAKDPLLKSYQHYLEQLIISKPHRLTEREEAILADKNHTGNGAFVRLFDEELASKKFILKPISGKGKEVSVSETEVLSLLYSSNRSQRAEAARSLTQGLTEEARRLTYIFNILAEDKSIDDKYRSYPTPEASRHQANEITQDMVDAMAEAVTENYSIVQRFYKLKKKVLGVNEIFDYDRYAPVITKEKPISWSKAQEMVLAAFYGFDKQYGSIAEEFFRKGWVDAAARSGKRGGAFCSFVTPDLHPYVFMNYSGTIREVFTLAHELGHAIHAYLMRKQTYLNFDTPLTIAETASVFAEMLLFDHLKATIKDPSQRFSLFVGKIESIFATVFRQISMYRFEQDLHGARRTHGELSTEEICAFWRKRQFEMFKGSVTLTPGYDYWWSYIPHFLHTPFYVYAYAFGELLTLSLYAQYKKEGAPFVDKYKTFLAAGGSLNPAQALKPFKVKLEDKRFWTSGIAMIEDMVREVEVLGAQAF